MEAFFYVWELKMNRCVIISAADIKNYDKIKSYLKEDDFYIVCDAGLNHVEKLNVKPNLVVGDFDSYKGFLTFSDKDVIVLPTVKDDTDTFYAVKEAIKRGYKDFLLLGVIGNRFDHSLCNISDLLYLENRGCRAMILDDYSEMSLITLDKEFLIDDSYSYFSLMNIKGDVKGVTIRNAKYPLDKIDIKAEYSYGISNEVIKGKKATVSIEDGTLLLVKVW